MGVEDTIRVLIADDHLIVRQGLRLILETEPGFVLVGEASDGAEAVALCAQHQPDVVLMDLRMPVMDGLAAIERLRHDMPQVAIVILTTFNEDDLMRRGLQAGARGYLLKDTDRRTLFNTIRAASRGETLLSPELVQQLLTQPERPTAKPTSAQPVGPALTERELEVLRLAGRGERSKEIAVRLGISERTVKAHLGNIYNKLGVDSRAAAVAVAARRGLLQP